MRILVKKKKNMLMCVHYPLNLQNPCIQYYTNVQENLRNLANKQLICLTLLRVMNTLGNQYVVNVLSTFNCIGSTYALYLNRFRENHYKL